MEYAATRGDNCKPHLHSFSQPLRLRVSSFPFSLPDRSAQKKCLVSLRKHTFPSIGKPEDKFRRCGETSAAQKQTELIGGVGGQEVRSGRGGPGCRAGGSDACDAAAPWQARALAVPSASGLGHDRRGGGQDWDGYAQHTVETEFTSKVVFREGGVGKAAGNVTLLCAQGGARL